ncbi:hypothetical protein HG535_0A02660 [Zygotorulaspora mrakii]|uniref:Cytochrome c oxidase-assembly factor COX23, mitochondrial n=1 Tax=Zygotorulaspora mrakii TaxID=42260 RepID=A0A7H9AVE7_ZYGMR|nr:uncharacterized protein HG535_0A02660 [Zygotorulaspora mrakii]QLG70328.1 hypothetical protein HG535_0A02660 [Zygotorulaspora mrakii]
MTNVQDNHKNGSQTTATNEAKNAPKVDFKDTSKVDFAPKGSDPDTFKYYPDNPESGMNRYLFTMKGPSEYYDPCQQSAQMSFNCLERNDYDRAMCREYFDAYRECKKQWLKARREARKQWD